MTINMPNNPDHGQRPLVIGNVAGAMEDAPDAM